MFTPLLLALLAPLSVASPVVRPGQAPPPPPLNLEDDELFDEELEGRRPPKPAEPRKEGLRYEVAFRGRYVSVPRGILNRWFHDAHDEGWPLPGQERPMMHGGAYGLELSVYDRKSSLALFYVEVVESRMGEGYWDDRETPPVPEDGSWIRPSRFFGAVVVGVNGLYDVPIVHLSQTSGWFGMSFQAGGGLGIAALVGRLDEWEMDPYTGIPAYDRFMAVEPERKKLGSPIWPVPDVTLALRFNFGDRVVLKLEGGLHGAFFYGATLGARI